MGCFMEIIFEVVFGTVAEVSVETISEYLPEKMNRKWKTFLKIIICILCLIPWIGVVVGICIIVENRSAKWNGISVILASIGIGVLELILAYFLDQHREKKIRKKLEERRKDD